MGRKKLTIEQLKSKCKFLKVKAGVRYWEDSYINGVADVDGVLTPCIVGTNKWQPLINIETGFIVNWEQGKQADIHFKVCDDGEYSLYDSSQRTLISYDGYVPNCLSIGERGYGDYIILSIDESGKIENWEMDFTEFIEEFTNN